MKKRKIIKKKLTISNEHGIGVSALLNESELFLPPSNRVPTRSGNHGKTGKSPKKFHT